MLAKLCWKIDKETRNWVKYTNQLIEQEVNMTVSSSGTKGLASLGRILWAYEPNTDRLADPVSVGVLEEILWTLFSNCTSSIRTTEPCCLHYINVCSLKCAKKRNYISQYGSLRSLSSLKGLRGIRNYARDSKRNLIHLLIDSFNECLPTVVLLIIIIYNVPWKLIRK